MLLGWLSIMACSGPAEVDPCEVGGGAGAVSTCLTPTHSDEHYIEQSLKYFDTMDHHDPWYTEDPLYSELVARWEWPPWLKLTGYGRDDMIAADQLLQFFPSTIPERECRAFPEQPFGRCYVVFYYDDHDGKPCPIYEEFTFNDAGEITFIEAWSDLPGFLPMPDDDPWAEGDEVNRLSTKVPGLGNPQGLIDLHSSWTHEAVAADDDVADFVARAHDWYAAWVLEVDAAGDDLWERGCGW